MVFHDRADAGRRLAAKLAHYKGEEAVVFALPRGGGCSEPGSRKCGRRKNRTTDRAAPPCFRSAGFRCLEISFDQKYESSAEDSIDGRRSRR